MTLHIVFINWKPRKNLSKLPVLRIFGNFLCDLFIVAETTVHEIPAKSWMYKKLRILDNQSASVAAFLPPVA